MIRVGVFGAGGRMGSTVCRAVHDAPDMELVAAVDPHHAGIDLHQLGVHGTQIQVAAKADALEHAGAEVAVDFTIIDAARENIRWCAEHGVHAVVGTSGFTAEECDELAAILANSKANAVVVPNFAIGAVLMMRFAELAAPYFDSAEVIELHHDQKADAPSGTAIATAQRIAAASKEWGEDPTTKIVVPGARGATGGPRPMVTRTVRSRIPTNRSGTEPPMPMTWTWAPQTLTRWLSTEVAGLTGPGPKRLERSAASKPPIYRHH